MENQNANYGDWTDFISLLRFCFVSAFPRFLWRTIVHALSNQRDYAEKNKITWLARVVPLFFTLHELHGVFGFESD